MQVKWMRYGSHHLRMAFTAIERANPVRWAVPMRLMELKTICFELAA